MKPKFVLRSGVVVLAMALLAGCGTSPTTPGKVQTTTDQSQVTGVIGIEGSLIDDGLLEASTQVSMAAALRGTHTAGAVAIQPFTFWRSISSESRQFQFAFSDTDTTGHPTTAVVTLLRDFTGTFNVVPQSTTSPGTPDLANIVHKPLEDHWKRLILFKRVPMTGFDQPVWRIAGVSGVDVTSQGATTVINSVRVHDESGLDTTITDPLAFIHLRQILRFAPEDSITLTVTTPRNDDVVVFYHHDRRARFTNNGDGTYTYGFRTSAYDGWRHFGVNALSHGTLFDDQLPYDSKAWILPYQVTTMAAMDYLP